MKNRVLVLVLLLILTINFVSPVLVFAKNAKQKDGVITNNKKLDTTVVPTSSILQPKASNQIKSQNINVIASYESEMLINDGAEFANNENLKATVTPYSKQPGSENAAFIYEYVQFTSSPEVNILSDTAEWSDWQLLPDPWNTSDVHFTIKDTSVGIKKIFMRYKAIKKLYDTTTDPYGADAYRYGRIDKITDIYYVDEIFFDNVPPVGNLTINNGAASTTSRTGSLQISASDTVNGIEGSGLNGMRITNNCNINDLESNNWSEWESEVTNKENFNLGTGNIMTVCVQVRDKAGNVATFSDSIEYKSYQYHYVSNPNTGIFGFSIGYGIGTPDDPYASMTSANLLQASVEFNRFMGCCWEKSSQIAGWFIPPSTITYVNRPDENTIEIYGVAINKYYPTQVRVNNQYGESCNFFNECNIVWEDPYRLETRSIGHVEVQLIDQNGNVIDKLWNDSSDGRYKFTLEVGVDIQEGDILHTKVVTWTDHYIDDLKYWANTTEDVMFEAHNLWSGDSEWVSIPEFTPDVLKEQIKQRYGYRFEENGFEWSSEELIWLLELFEYLKNVDPKILDTETTAFLRDANEEPCDTTDKPEAACATLTGIWFISDRYAGFANKLDGNYGIIDRETAFKITVTHELAHAWHIKYPLFLEDFGRISWESESFIKLDADGCDFITDYAFEGRAEDFAETYAVRLIKPELYRMRYNDFKENNPDGCNEDSYESSDLFEKFNFFNN